MIFSNANSPMLHLKEAPGLYGELKIEESLIQKIWEEQLFDPAALRTLCGERVTVLSQGE